jgi:hypothetical protein
MHENGPAGPKRGRCRGSGALLALLVLLGLAGCGGGGGDDPLEASATTAPAESNGSPARATAPESVAASATPAAASVYAADAAPPLVIRRQPLGADVREGSVAQFSVDAEGPASITYQWLRDEEVIEGATGPVLQWQVSPADHLSRFRVLIRAGGATLQSGSAVLRVVRS